MDGPSLPESLDPEAVASIFYRYLAVNSETGTARENAAADFVISSLRGLPYFTERPEQLALEPLPDDPFGRSIAWALVPAGAAGAAELEGFMARQMPLYGRAYAIPFASIDEVAMPCVNVGPWGKDFHKLGERVLKEDAFERAPALLLKALAFAWGRGP